jgi:hypothetical protein
MMTRDLSAARRGGGGGGALPFCELSFVMNDIILFFMPMMNVVLLLLLSLTLRFIDEITLTLTSL